MSQYTVYAMYPSSLGDPVEASDVDRMNDLLDEEIDAAGIVARVIVTEDAGRYTLYESGHTFIAGLDDAVDAAWQRFNAGA
jgi:hypothetical protein